MFHAQHCIDTQLIGYQLYLVAAPSAVLPFQVEDISHPISELEKPESHHVRVGQTTRFNNRTLDLRTPVSQSIFRIHSGVTKLFREFLDNEGFIGEAVQSSCSKQHSVDPCHRNTIVETSTFRYRVRRRCVQGGLFPSACLSRSGSDALPLSNFRNTHHLYPESSTG